MSEQETLHLTTGQPPAQAGPLVRAQFLCGAIRIAIENVGEL
jgi:hypothetical protein